MTFKVGNGSSGFRGKNEKRKDGEGDKNKQPTTQDSRGSQTALCCVLCSERERDGGGEGRKGHYIPPLGGQVRAGGLLLGVSSWAAELMQHGFIPVGRAEGEGQSRTETGWTLGPPDTKAFLPGILAAPPPWLLSLCVILR